VRMLGASLLRRCVDGSAMLRQVAGVGWGGDQSWNRFGIRDPSILTNAAGHPVLDEAGRFAMFFNARDRATTDGGVTCVGLAQGTMESGWTSEPQPVFVDGAYAAQGSVLQLAPDHFRMYYSPDTLWGFALASSTDGRCWRRFGTRPILEPGQFGVRRMGLPFVRRIGQRWIMLFEGMAGSGFHIYLATSLDGIEWRAGNQGRSVYTPADGAWDCLGQANPSLYVENEEAEDSGYFIFYNGCREVHAWDIGVLRSDSLEGPWRSSPAPVLCRGQQGGWNAGRVEGARLVERPEGLPGVVYFALPTTDSYAGGRIAFASIDAAANCAPMAERNAGAERAYNDQLALRYFSVWDNFPIQRFSTDMEFRLIDKVVSPLSKVILLGSGGGRELPVLLNKGCRVTAVDISPQMLAVGRQRYADADVGWIEADLHELPAELVDFDAGICLGAVFNYLREPDLFLANARRCLKPGGSLVLAVINSRHPTEAHVRTELSDGRVRVLYSVSQLEQMLGAIGFRVEKTIGVRFLVDLLPAEWNSKPAQQPSGTEILNRLLVAEAELSEHMSAEKAKFILLHAVARATDPPVTVRALVCS